MDRTNVVQSLVARQVLERQLHELKLLPEDEGLGKVAFYAFKNIWADNGDAVSIQYSGTGALKADITRTGKRTITGLMNDGLNSITRYWLNNFKDGDMQDAYDVFLGNKSLPSQHPVEPFVNLRNILRVVLLAIFFVLLFLLFKAPSALRDSSFITAVTLVLSFVCAVMVFLGILKHNGRFLVNNPSSLLKQHTR